MTRRVKAVVVDGQKFFTLRNKGEILDELLCDQCGKSDSYKSGESCWIFNALKRVNEEVNLVALDKCDKFQPVFGFIPPLNNLVGRFNTFRMGESASSRLDVGDSVALFDTKAKKVFGVGEVTGLFSGQFDRMLLQHAKNNHTQIGNTTNPVDSLSKIVKRMYGPHIVNDKAIVSVIYINTLLNK